MAELSLWISQGAEFGWFFYFCALLTFAAPTLAYFCVFCCSLDRGWGEEANSFARCCRSSEIKVHLVCCCCWWSCNYPRWWWRIPFAAALSYAGRQSMERRVQPRAVPGLAALRPRAVPKVEQTMTSSWQVFVVLTRWATQLFFRFWPARPCYKLARFPVCFSQIFGFLFQNCFGLLFVCLGQTLIY